MRSSYFSIHFPALLICILFPTIGLSQDYVDLMNAPGDHTFSEIVDRFNEFAKGKNPKDIPYYNQFKRWEIRQGSLLGEGGKLMNSVQKNYQAYQKIEAAINDQRAPGGLWTEIGPLNYTLGYAQSGGHGRVNCIEFHPTNSNIIFIGTAAGGLWKTLDGGLSWFPRTDGLPIAGVSDIVVHPNNPNIIYILTGDGDGNNTYSIGVLKSVDGGLTWAQTDMIWDLEDASKGYRLLMHPTNPQTLYLAASTGIYKTSDGGNNWSLKRSGVFTDIEIKPGSDSVMYAVTTRKFYHSLDAGDTWQLSDTSSTLPTTGFSRIAIGVTDDSPQIIFLLYGGGVTGYKGLYRSVNQGTTWSLVSSTPNIMGRSSTGADSSHQAWYDIAILVDPNQESVIYTGGINVWKSTTAGFSWSLSSYFYPESNAWGYVHADVHALEMNNGILYAASDGGVYKSVNGGVDWTTISTGLGVRQFYHIDYENGIYLGGSQDNGTCQGLISSTTSEMALGSDGMACLINYNNTDIRYMSSQSNRWKTTDAGASFTHIDPVNGDGDDTISDIWRSDWTMDPDNPERLFMAEHDVYRTTNGGTNWTLIFDMPIDSRVFALTQGVDDTETLYAAQDFAIYKTSNVITGSQPTWVDIKYNLPIFGARRITSVAVDPNDADRVWVSLAGYISGQKIYVLQPNDTVWTNVSEDLPNVPIHKIVYQPGSNEGLYVGTEIGIFYTNTTIDGWIPYMNGLPVVPVFDLVIEDGLLLAGTFGRGLWKSNLFSSCPLAYSLTPANDPSNPNSTGVQRYGATLSISSTRQIAGGIGTDVIYRAGNYVRLDPGFVVKAQNEFEAKIGGCNQ